MPTPDPIDRFRRDFLALAGEPERIGLAVSGGPDSLALLILAHRAFPGCIEAATVDHRLRPANAAEAALVASLCAKLRTPHATLSDPGATIAGASAQARARGLRYRLLRAWAAERGLTRLVTAHHADDQAETVLMRLARGAGVAGLAGIRARREEERLLVLRPLLGWRRAELAEIVREAGHEAVDDPSNRSHAFDRTRFRALLDRTDLLAPDRLAAAAAHLADAEQALAWAAEREWSARARCAEDAIELDAADLPREIQRRLAVRAVSTVSGSCDWRVDALGAAVLAALASGARVNLAGVSISGGASWRFEPEPPRRSR
ncbi:MAG TPA: tRNA lysidine(34) synthetase TilS [Allosphingosinicella sp.]|jgi:tRNA(Ile)-lysidine synthase